MYHQPVTLKQSPTRPPFHQTMFTNRDQSPDEEIWYHGSPEEDLTEISEMRTSRGLFFTRDPETAGYYTGRDDAGCIYAARLHLRKVADLDDDLVFSELAREAIWDLKEERDEEKVIAFLERVLAEYGAERPAIQAFLVEHGISLEDITPEWPLRSELDFAFVDGGDIAEMIGALAREVPEVQEQFDLAAPLVSRTIEDARAGYGSQEFYMKYQDAFLDAARRLGYDAVDMEDPSSTGESYSRAVLYSACVELIPELFVWPGRSRRESRGRSI